MSKVHIGPHTHPDPHDETQTFDREINLRGILWTGVVLVVVTVASQILMWGMLKGFGKYDERHDARPALMMAGKKQALPPEPQLQTSPPDDMRSELLEENDKLGHAAWADRQQGTVRLPIDVAMQVIASRGVGAEVVGGNPAAAGAAVTDPTQVRQQIESQPNAGQGNRAPGALIQNSRQPSQAGTATPGAAATATPGQKPPAAQERR
jgi:hypothetical protein